MLEYTISEVVLGWEVVLGPGHRIPSPPSPRQKTMWATVRDTSKYPVYAFSRSAHGTGRDNGRGKSVLEPLPSVLELPPKQ